LGSHHSRAGFRTGEFQKGNEKERKKGKGPEGGKRKIVKCEEERGGKKRTEGRLKGWGKRGLGARRKEGRGKKREL